MNETTITPLKKSKNTIEGFKEKIYQNKFILDGYSNS